MFCCHCGYENHRSISACWNCGKPPHWAEIVPWQATGVPASFAERPILATPVVARRRRPAITVAALAALVVILAGVGQGPWLAAPVSPAPQPLRAVRGTLPAPADLTAPERVQPNEQVTFFSKDSHSAGDLRPRPANAAVMGATGPRGRGELRLRNGAGSDAVVKLVSTDRTSVRKIYIRADQEAHLKGVADGSYAIRFCEIESWGEGLVVLDPPRRCFRFEHSFRFQTERTTDEIRWTILQLTLYAVPSGNVRIEPISPGDF